MARKIKLELTEPQFNAIVELITDIESMRGGGDAEQEYKWKKNIRLAFAALRKNGFDVLGSDV